MHRLLHFVFIATLSCSALAQDWIGHATITTGAPSGSCSGPSELSVDRNGTGIYVCGANGQWPASPNIGGATIPSGLITLIVSGTCPSGWTEVSVLNGKMLRGTVAANNDVGTLGGNATITPTGTVTQPALTMNAYTPVGTVSAPTFTGSQGTVPAETFTGSSGTVPAETFTGSLGTIPAETFTGSALATHTHTVTPTGTNSSVAVATTSGSKAGSSTGAFTAIAGAAAGSSFTVGAETFTGTQDTTSAISAGTPAGTNSTTAFTPAGTNSTASFTPAGTNSSTTFTPAGTNSAPTFTGTQATLTGAVSQPTFQGNAIDPSPSYLKVIFCAKQ